MTTTSSVTQDPNTQVAAAAVALEYIDAICELTGDYSITAPQVTLLTLLRVHGQVYQQSLNKFTRVKRSSNSRNIAKLGIGESPLKAPGLGLVESIQDLADRRLQIIRLTPKGLALVTEACNRAAKFLPKKV